MTVLEITDVLTDGPGMHSMDGVDRTSNTNYNFSPYTTATQRHFLRDITRANIKSVKSQPSYEPLEPARRPLTLELLAVFAGE